MNNNFLLPFPVISKSKNCPNQIAKINLLKMCQNFLQILNKKYMLFRGPSQRDMIEKCNV